MKSFGNSKRTLPLDCDRRRAADSEEDMLSTQNPAGGVSGMINC
jgi:hypothetical protein